MLEYLQTTLRESPKLGVSLITNLAGSSCGSCETANRYFSQN
ncbi:hypothetical protein KC19_1G123800 [Ceratodon purpureus]|uniref:Uncharacterized protein n=1 Tax=Ceratodon purpureus TaxID=3225 RepID=A0A8T0J493_CERPU|nr:hypothetical protein KC19_1G123800 [Ceratodon purpureus]